MNTEEFKHYQKQLNVQRINQMNSVPKLSPKVLLGDEDFDVLLEDIPLSISLPPLETAKQENCITNQPTTNALF